MKIKIKIKLLIKLITKYNRKIIYYHHIKTKIIKLIQIIRVNFVIIKCKREII